MGSETIILLIICPQVDFHSRGSFSIAGADEDSVRIANLINANGKHINEVCVIMESRHKMQRVSISHSIFWENSKGIHPPVGTIITQSDVMKKIWVPKDPSLIGHVLFYLDELNKCPGFKLVIQPEHCLMGSEGHCVVPVINNALQHWAGLMNKSVEYVRKGMNPITEHFSAIRAHVPIPTDPNTTTDFMLLQKLNRADHLIVCGESRMKHVKSTVTDLLSELGSDYAPRVKILQDGMSGGEPTDIASWETDLTKLGVTVCKTTDVFSHVIKI